jgi:hypothetical protein
MLDGVELVALHADGGLGQTQSLHEDTGPADDPLALLQHEAVVGGDIGLAFRAVEDQGVGLADGGTDFYVGGESRAAHAGNTGGLDDLYQLFGCKSFDVAAGFTIGTKGILVIVLDHDGHDLISGGGRPGLHGDNFAGNARVDRRTKTGDLADLLAYSDLVSHVHNRLAGRAQVHIHRNDDLSGSLGERDDRFPLRCLFMLGGVDAAIKFMVHSITSVLSLAA